MKDRALNGIDEFGLLLALPLLVGQLYREPLSSPACQSGPGAVAPEAEVRTPSPQTFLALGDGDEHLQGVIRESIGILRPTLSQKRWHLLLVAILMGSPVAQSVISLSQ